MHWIIELFSGSIARKMGLTIFLASIAITLISAGAFLYLRLQTDLKQIETQMVEISQSHLASISERVWVADYKSLELDLIGMKENHAIKYLSVVDNGRTLAKVGQQPSQNAINRSYIIYHPYQGKPLKIGQLNIVATSAEVYQDFFSTAMSAVILFAMQTFLLTGLVFVLFNRHITRHLRKIATFAGHIKLSNIDETLTLSRHKTKAPDELDVLINALTSMQHQLNKSVRQLKENEENLSSMLNSIGDAVIATDTQGAIIRMNPTAEKLTGWSAAESLQTPIEKVFSIVNSTTHQALENPIHRALFSGKIAFINNDVTLIDKSGHEYRIESNSALIKNSDQDIIGGILVFHDESEQHKIRQILRENEMRLKLHVEQTPLGVIEWDTDFIAKEWNPAAEKIFGYNRNEATGLQYKDFLAPKSSIDSDTDSLESFYNDPDVDHRVREHITKDGKNIVCEWYNTPLMDANGKLMGVASLVQDISERVHHDRALTQHRLEQKQLLDYMLDAVISINVDGVILSANKSAETLFGYTAKEILGIDAVELVAQNSQQHYAAALHSLIDNQSNDVFLKANETSVIDKQGRVLPVRYTVGKPPSDDIENQRYIVSIHNLTAEKQKEEQLRHSQKMDALGKVTGGIAHDYNNMLGVILGYTELLRLAMPKTPQLEGYLEKIEQAGERGATLTKKMLSLSRHQPIEASVVDINSVLFEQQYMLQKLLTARISIDMQLSPSPWMVLIDAGDFLDVIINLSINAMHATDASGSLKFRSTNKTYTEHNGAAPNLLAGDYVVLEISDTGKGMDKDTLDHIFDPFFTTKGEKGSGLGLSQVYGFMERSHGTITARSKLDVGTCFTLYFPRFQPNSDAPKEGIEVPELTLLRGNETILVVDDEVNLLALAKEILSNNGYNVYIASSGEEALGILKEKKINLVLSDIVMPEMDGYDLAHEIKIRHPRTLIQLVSGFNDAFNARNFDPDLYKNIINKPYSSDILLRKIRKALDKTVFKPKAGDISMKP